jgi:hypothetical protein
MAGLWRLFSPTFVPGGAVRIAVTAPDPYSGYTFFSFAFPLQFLSLENDEMSLVGYGAAAQLHSASFRVPSPCIDGFTVRFLKCIHGKSNGAALVWTWKALANDLHSLPLLKQLSANHDEQR